MHRILNNQGNKAKTNEKTTAHLSGWLKLKDRLLPSVCKDVEELELSYVGKLNTKWHNLFGKQLVISLKLSGHLFCDPDILFLTFYSKEIKTYIYTNTYTGMFIVYLFVTFCNIQNMESIKISQQQLKV